MALDIYTTVELLPVVETIKPQTYFWRDSFFGRTVNFTTPQIAFEQLPTEQRMAPFVIPTAQGRIMSAKGRTSKTFAPAYVKPKHEVDPNMNAILQRSAGEAIGGSLTPGQRWDAAVANNMQLELDMIDRREEWMSAQVMMFGSVLVQGEDYPPTLVDYGRDASLTTVLTGTARWGQSAADPMGNIRAKRTAAFALSSRPTGALVMGLDAFDLFYADAKTAALLTASQNYRLPGNNIELSSFSDGSTPLEYRGFIQGANGQGRLEIWTYSQTYEDYDGTVQPIMNSLDVVGVPSAGEAVDGFFCYGAIKDARAGLQALSRFPKMWQVEDPSVVYTMTQSSPLPVICRPNATWRIRVA